MHVTVYLSAGPPLSYDSSRDDLEKVRARLTERFVTFDLLDSTVLINRDHIVRIDLDKET